MERPAEIELFHCKTISFNAQIILLNDETIWFNMEPQFETKWQDKVKNGS